MRQVAGRGNCDENRVAIVGGKRGPGQTFAGFSGRVCGGVIGNEEVIYSIKTEESKCVRVTAK